MENKKKIGFLVTVIIMALAIIGLTISMVIVAGRVSIENSMLVVYKTKNVEATIVSSAKYYRSATDSNPTAIKFSGTNREIITQEISASTKQEDMTATAYEEQKLGAYGYAVYSFVITNKSTATNQANKLYIEITTSSPGDETNITSVVTSSTISSEDAFNKAKVLDDSKTNLDEFDITLLDANQTVYYVVVLSVTDYLKDADFTSNVLINLTSTSANS